MTYQFRCLLHSETASGSIVVGDQGDASFESGGLGRDGASPLSPVEPQLPARGA
jgi:hypothetical protein